MAIAHVAAGTRLKADVSLTGSPQSVALPAGHVSGHWLLLVIITEDNAGPSATPSGWTSLGNFSAGASTNVPYAGRPHVWLYHRIDNGSLGASVSVSFSTSSWPTGNPYVLAWTEAYSGADNTGAVEIVQGSSSTATTDAQAHPQLTTAVNNDWLITIRAVGADTAKTFTISGGTNTERVDDSHGSPAAPSGSLYDAGPLAPGAQTQRTTTASAAVQYGSVMVSIAIKEASSASAVTAVAGTAMVAATGEEPSVDAVVGPWDLCGVDGLPDYRTAIDWDMDGSLDETGTILSDNPYFRTGIDGYSASNSTLAWDDKVTFTFPVLKITPNGISASGGANASPHTAVGSVTAGQDYIVDLWAYSPAGWSDLRSAVDWFDSADAFLSSGLPSGVAVTSGVWTRLRATVTAPASASRASIRARHGSTPSAGDIWYVYGLRLIDPSTGAELMALGPGEDITSLEIDDVVTTYGRDQDRQLSPGAVGAASLGLCNVNREYSPENVGGALYGNLDPARDARFQVEWAGAVFPLFRGKIDDYDVSADFSDRNVTFTFLDGLALLQGYPLSTGVYGSMRTGELINLILDEAGWTGGRDLDLGTTIVKYWWGEGTDALSAVRDLVRSEGPPAVAYVAPDGTFHFHDRHHRIQTSTSINVQGTFVQGALGECDVSVPAGLSIAQPFVYQHGWRDIVNSVTFEVQDRIPSSVFEDVWTSEDTIVLSNGQSADVDISTSDPFLDAITPVEGTDFTKTGAGSVTVGLSRTSGQSAKITVMASGGGAIVTGLRMRARPIPVVKTVKVIRQDSGSITAHGEKTNPDPAPWAGVHDAGAIADMILLHYARRRPTVQVRVVTQDPAHFVQVLQRTISDRVRIQNDEMGLNGDFFVERITHTIQRFNQTGKPPVHAVVFGCEKEQDVIANPFTFDKRGAGFDDGTFDAQITDSGDTVFTFDHPVQGQFDLGLFGT